MSVRQEVIGEHRLILGDCAEALSLAGVVDLVLTDPPYGIDYGRAGGFSASHGWGQWRENVAWDVERPDRAIFDAMRACSRDQIIWGGNYFTDFLPPTMQWLVWDKGQRDFSLADCELAWTNLDKPVRHITWMWNGMLRKGQEARNEHPTQKPLGVMEWCINQLPADCATILDPFMGSGTTGVACANLGRQFIGCEIEERYFDIACRRIEEAYRQPRLFDEPPPKPVQGSMFGDAA